VELTARKHGWEGADGEERQKRSEKAYKKWEDSSGEDRI